jgi:phosphoglycerate dehydrogenase-like enzyme
VCSASTRGSRIGRPAWSTSLPPTGAARILSISPDQSIAWGRCVVTQDLIAALQSGQLAGAGLDVVDPETLPPDSPLWGMPNVPITPHVAILGTPYRRKWEAILLENCRRFAAGQPLLNVVDKGKWF